MRNVVFVGNCQVSAMRTLYSRFVAPHTKDRVVYVESFTSPSGQAQDDIRSADVLVRQVQDFSSKTDDIETAAPVFKVPVVSAKFLWPFSGRPHPKNAPEPGLRGGPFSGHMGDSYMNRLLVADVPQERVADQCIAMDVAAEVDLDRLFHISQSKQKRLDDELGYGVAAIVEEYFRTERLFRTPLHPGLRIQNHLAATLFRAMGVDEAIVDRLIRLQRTVPLPRAELPIHPNTLAHFGVQCTDAYEFLEEGPCTFGEFAGRYAGYRWNRDLAAGLAAARAGVDGPEALALLTRGVAESPSSGAGWRRLSQVYEGLGRPAEAISAARRATEVGPDIALHHTTLGELLAKAQDHAGAAAAFADAVRADPANSSARLRWAHLLVRAGKPDEAMKVAEGLVSDPVEPPREVVLASIAQLRGGIAATLLSSQQQPQPPA